MKQTVWAAIGCVSLIDSIVLVALGKINAGTIIPAVIGLGFLLIAFFHRTIERGQQNATFRRAWAGACWLFAFWLLSVAAFVAWNLSTTPGADAIPEETSYLVVLGAGLQGLEPSPTLQFRLDKAIEISRTHPQMKVIVSGGQGANEAIAEAEAMRAYLLRQGLPEARIMRENRSRTTVENLRFSALLLEQAGVKLATTPVGIVTSDYHSLRARRIARLAGYRQAWIAGAPVPWWIAPNSWLREYFAVLWGALGERFKD